MKQSSTEYRGYTIQVTQHRPRHNSVSIRSNGYRGVAVRVDGPDFRSVAQARDAGRFVVNERLAMERRNTNAMERRPVSTHKNGHAPGVGAYVTA